jgi:hypothetical protein
VRHGHAFDFHSLLVARGARLVNLPRQAVGSQEKYFSIWRSVFPILGVASLLDQWWIFRDARTIREQGPSTASNHKLVNRRTDGGSTRSRGILSVCLAAPTPISVLANSRLIGAGGRLKSRHTAVFTLLPLEISEGRGGTLSATL